MRLRLTRHSTNDTHAARNRPAFDWSDAHYSWLTILPVARVADTALALPSLRAAVVELGHLSGRPRASVQLQVGDTAGELFAVAREVWIASQREIPSCGCDRRRDADRLQRPSVHKQRQVAGTLDDTHVVPGVLLNRCPARRIATARFDAQRRVSLRTRRCARDHPRCGTRRSVPVPTGRSRAARRIAGRPYIPFAGTPAVGKATCHPCRSIPRPDPVCHPGLVRISTRWLTRVFRRMDQDCPSAPLAR